MVKVRDGKSERRKSPKQGSIFDLFNELVYVPDLLNLEGFDIEVAYVHVEEHRRHDPKRAWRRKHWVIDEKRLVEVLGTDRIPDARALFEMVLGTISDQFTTEDISQHLKITRSMAQKIAYCFRQASVIESNLKRGNALIYRRVAT